MLFNNATTLTEINHSSTATEAKTEQAGAVATISTRIRMVLGSNIGWVQTILIEVSRGYPQSPPRASTGIVS
jgi:hypothetical protein